MASRYPMAKLVPAEKISEGLTIISRGGAKLLVLEVKRTEDSIRFFTDDGHYELYSYKELVPHTGTIEGLI